MAVDRFLFLPLRLTYESGSRLVADPVNHSDPTTAWSTTPTPQYSPVPSEQIVHFLGYPIATQCILGILMMVMLVLSVCGNGVVCYLVYQNTAMRSAINLLLASMALSNTFLGILCMPADFLTLVFDGRWVLGDIVCQVQAFLFNSLSLVSVFVLGLISIDRYIILILRRDKITSYTCKILLGATWSLSMLANLPVLFGWPPFLPFTGQTHGELVFAQGPLEMAYVCTHFLVSCPLPVLVMLFCYFSILCHVRQDGVRVSSSQAQDLRGVSPPATAGGTAKRYSLANIARSRLLLVDMRFKTRTFATILIVFLSFCVFRLPYALCTFAWNLTWHSPTSTYPYLVWWHYLNATFNPIIYAWRIRRFRVACLELFPVLGACFNPFPGSKEQQFRPRPSTIYQLSEPSFFTPNSSQPTIDVADDDDDFDD